MAITVCGFDSAAAEATGATDFGADPIIGGATSDVAAGAARIGFGAFMAASCGRAAAAATACAIAVAFAVVAAWNGLMYGADGGTAVLVGALTAPIRPSSNVAAPAFGVVL